MTTHLNVRILSHAYNIAQTHLFAIVHHHTCIVHTYRYTNTHKHIHKHIHKNKYKHTNSKKDSNAQSCIWKYKNTNTQKHTQT